MVGLHLQARGWTLQREGTASAQKLFLHCHVRCHQRFDNKWVRMPIITTASAKVERTPEEPEPTAEEPEVLVGQGSEAGDAVVSFALGAVDLRDDLQSPFPTFWCVAADPFGNYDALDSDIEEELTEEEGLPKENLPASDYSNEEEESLAEPGKMLTSLSRLSISSDSAKDIKPYLIWNRECYDGLTLKILELLDKGYRRFLVLGTAGVGKSWFAVVWILKLAIQRCAVVIKQEMQFHILDFSSEQPVVSGPHGELDALVQFYLRKPSTWLVIDGRQTERLRYRCMMLVACSTKPNNFKEFRKHSRAVTLYMPAWREEEIEKFLHDFEPYRRKFPWMCISKKKHAMEVYRSIGGVPRYVVNSNQSEDGLTALETAIRAFCANIDVGLQVLSGSYVRDISDAILHIYTDDGYRQPLHELASGYVRSSIRVQLLMGNDVRITSLLAATYDKSNVGVLWGFSYELQVHKLLSAGGEFRVKKVYPGGSDDPVVVTIPPRTMLLLESLDEIRRKAANGMYLIPKQANFASIDSLLGFIGVQVFKPTSKDHGFKVSGLKDVDEQLQQASYQLWSCVPRELFDTIGYQDYLTLEGKPYGRRDKVLDKFEQFVCEVDYHKIVSSPLMRSN